MVYNDKVLKQNGLKNKGFYTVTHHYFKDGIEKCEPHDDLVGYFETKEEAEHFIKKYSNFHVYGFSKFNGKPLYCGSLSSDFIYFNDWESGKIPTPWMEWQSCNKN